LIPRFYDISAGEILLDGVNIRDIPLSFLRKNIGMVSQNVFLFDGTVRDNIAYGAPDATDEEIAEAAKKANIYDDIMALPNGLDTYVGERGVKLSGGQKQRISIARVFLKDPPILILDEATSALDNESERLVQRSLETLAKGRTTFTVAHRLTTIKNADRILVLTENGIEESGTHEELIAKNGIYSELYSLYTEI
jgi:ATP-binding cassette subfamily B protein